MFDWIGDYAAFSWDSGAAAVFVFGVAMLALAVVVLAVLAGVVQCGAWFVEGFRRGAARSKAERDSAPS